MPTATPAIGMRFFVSHSSPACRQPFSLIFKDTSPFCENDKEKKNIKSCKTKDQKHST